MLDFLQTHPSIFIIAAIFIIIILILVFLTKKLPDDQKREETSNYIELQELGSQVISRETDSIQTTLPVPKLSKKLRHNRNQLKKSPHIYDTPRAREFATISESLSEESSNSFSYIPVETHHPSSSKDQFVIYRQLRSQDEGNRISVSDVNRNGNYIKFNDEFDHFDEFGQSCVDTTMRLTVDFGANN